MSAEQLCQPSSYPGTVFNKELAAVSPAAYQGLNPWANSTLNSLRVITSLNVNKLVYPNTLPTISKKDDDKLIPSPVQYLVEDTGGGVLQFIEYIQPLSVVNVNFNALFQYYTVVSGNPLISELNNNCPLFLFTYQNPSAIGDTTYIRFPLNSGGYIFYFRQFDIGESGIFNFRFTNGDGSQTSNNTINLSSQGLGVHTFNFTFVNSVPGLCEIQIECVGSTSGNFRSNIIDTWITTN